MQSDADEHSPDPEREFRKLVLALAHEAGFRLNFALFRSRPFRDQYVARLRQELAAQKIFLSTADLHDAPRPVLLTDLERHLRETPTPTGMTRAVVVLGLEDKLGLAIAGLPGGDDERGILHTANLHRDLFPERCPCPVVFWLTDSAMREFSTQAPDLWHWRAHTFRFFDPAGLSESHLLQRAESGAIFGGPLPYRTAKEMEDALALYQAALRRYQGAEAETKPEALELRDRLATLLKNLGRLAEAEPLVRHNLTICERVLGPDHVNTLSSLNRLAYLLTDRGDVSGAEALYRRALEGYERVLGPEHPDTLICVNNLAVMLESKGDLAAAETLFQRALKAYEREPVKERADTLITINNLASFLCAKGDLTSAEPLFRKVLAARERVLGPEHPDTLESINNLAGLLRAKGDMAGAEPLFRRGLADRERVLGLEHPATLISVNNLANLLYAKGDLAEADPLFRRALDAFERVLGPEHPSTLGSVNNLAGLLTAKGDLATAEQMYERASRGARQRLGPDHPDTKVYEKSLSRLREMLSRQSEPPFRSPPCPQVRLDTQPVR
ncbi:hypothetical protein LBMAG56_07400 [Verrucomicrobiota bacterium]|nr:hypothetical protein LBMAG56_07400 [Verrucomicrobiota bacterium]